MNEGSGRGFRIRPEAGSPPEDPEALFRGLRRSKDVRFLASHQSDLLRSYCADHIRTSDIALELPTGSGKTLVGLLLGEWRRQRFGERILYLCPTRQLCYQVGRLAREDYGIIAHPLVGRQVEYDPAAYGSYLDAGAIAITTYSGVFNSNPRLNDANILILDDAHAAEGYVSSLWTLPIRRSDTPELYAELLELLAPAMPRYVLSSLRSSQPEPGIFMLPEPAFYEQAMAVMDLLDADVEQGTTDQVRFSWPMIREHLDAVQVFYSWSEIALRPIIPPAMTHRAFSDATQRVYMSATLGEGGELERIFGVPTIGRLPVPKGWDRQGLGRRLILLPDRSLPPADCELLCEEAIEQHGRALVLCPTRVSADAVNRTLSDRLEHHAILSAADVETDMTRFTDNPRAVLVLSGRYDGIDLRDAACRLLIINGLPVGINLQERFQYERLGAIALLQDRIRTRITQAMGRCTRGPTDYADVILVGQELHQFCTLRENRLALHPELQAEMSFGLEQSSGRSAAADFIDLMAIFLRQDREWKPAEDEIVRSRAKFEKVIPKSTMTLAATVAREIRYSTYLWAGDYEGALSAAREVADRLEGDELRSYRSWWYYLAGTAAWLSHTVFGRPGHDSVAREMWERARAASPMQPWFREIQVALKIPGEPAAEEIGQSADHAAENVATRLVKMGLAGRTFERLMGESRAKLSGTDHAAFSFGLDELGNYLGWQAQRPSGQGAPDCVWSLGDEYCVLFEVKTEESREGSISIATSREAKGHLDWARANLNGRITNLACVVVSPRQFLDRSACPHVVGLSYFPPQAVADLFVDVATVLRRTRSQSAENEPLTMRLNIYEAYRDARLLPKDVFERLTAKQLADVAIR